jgi:peptidoglycan hydrolase-like protein with peptidoglycan-binding domain
METCHRCGTVLPTTPGARYCPNCGEMTNVASDPTQAFAAVGRGPGESGMTWALPPQPAAPSAPQSNSPRPDPTQALSPQGIPPESDLYAGLFRPEGGAPANPNATQVMPPVDPGTAMAPAAYDQPAYDQPIDYQAGGGGHYSEPYDANYAGYADDHNGEPAAAPRSSRAAMIGIGVAAGAILVIVVSLITIGGGTPTPAATPGSQATEIVTPTSTATSGPATTQTSTTTSSSPSTTARSTAPHPPGTLALGETGGEVKWLQARLKQLHLYNGEISGTFDQATQAAVIVFQGRTHPADPSGIVGRSTKTALIAAGSQPRLSIVFPGGGGDKHGKGANPDDVKRLQHALSSALNTGVKATGQFDMDTFGAVMRYQGAVGLAPDGVVGDKVWSALQQGKIVG